MNKKFWIAFGVAFVLVYGLEMVYHGMILHNFYLRNPQGFLPAAMSQARMPWMAVGYLILAFLWTYFFNRFATEKNVIKGIHHGVSYMIFLHVPLAFVTYAVYQISGCVYLFWTIGAVIQGAIIGAVMGAIMKEKVKDVCPKIKIEDEQESKQTRTREKIRYIRFKSDS